MNYDGYVTDLALAADTGPAGRKGSERNKDRMSYRHLAYQIDLTQVATMEVCSVVVSTVQTLSFPRKYKTPRSCVHTPFSAVRSLHVSFPLLSFTVLLLI
jgi:hypothetical protein